MKSNNWWETMPRNTPSEIAAFQRRAIVHHKYFAENLVDASGHQSETHAYLGMCFDEAMRGDYYSHVYSA